MTLVEDETYRLEDWYLASSVVVVRLNFSNIILVFHFELRQLRRCIIVFIQVLTCWWSQSVNGLLSVRELLHLAGGQAVS